MAGAGWLRVKLITSPLAAMMVATPICGDTLMRSRSAWYMRALPKAARRAACDGPAVRAASATSASMLSSTW